MEIKEKIKKFKENFECVKYNNSEMFKLAYDIIEYMFKHTKYSIEYNQTENNEIECYLNEWENIINFSYDYNKIKNSHLVFTYKKSDNNSIMNFMRFTAELMVIYYYIVNFYKDEE